MIEEAKEPNGMRSENCMCPISDGSLSEAQTIDGRRKSYLNSFLGLSVFEMRWFTTGSATRQAVKWRGNPWLNRPYHT
jgi:hypothetical protein